MAADTHVPWWYRQILKNRQSTLSLPTTRPGPNVECWRSSQVEKYFLITDIVNNIVHFTRYGRLEISETLTKAMQVLLELTTQMSVRLFVVFCKFSGRFVPHNLQIEVPWNRKLRKVPFGRSANLRRNSRRRKSSSEHKKSLVTALPLVICNYALDTEACCSQVGRALLRK